MTGPPGGGSRRPELVIEDHASPRVAGGLARPARAAADVEAHAQTVFAAAARPGLVCPPGRRPRSPSQYPATVCSGCSASLSRRSSGAPGSGGRSSPRCARRAPEAVPYLQVEARNAPAIALYRAARLHRGLPLPAPRRARFRRPGGQDTNPGSRRGVSAPVSAFRPPEHSPGRAARGSCSSLRHVPQPSSRTIANTPTTTMIARSAEAGSRRPPRAPRMPPMIDPTAISAAGAPGHVGGEHEDDAGDEVDQAGEHDLERVDALQVIVERQRQDGQQQDALSGAEVAAVDAGGEHADRGQRPGVLAAAASSDAAPPAPARSGAAARSGRARG